MEDFRMEYLESLRLWLDAGHRLFEVHADERDRLHWQQINTKRIEALQVHERDVRAIPRSFIFAERDLLLRFDGHFYSAPRDRLTQAPFCALSFDLQAIACQEPVSACVGNASRLISLCMGIIPCLHGYEREELSVHGGEPDQRTASVSPVARRQGDRGTMSRGKASFGAVLTGIERWEVFTLDLIGSDQCTNLYPSRSPFLLEKQTTKTGQLLNRDDYWEVRLFPCFELPASGLDPNGFDDNLSNRSGNPGCPAPEWEESREQWRSNRGASQ